MSHRAQRVFCEGVRDRFPDRFKNADVLDVGSLDVNGNNRYLFDGGTYLGCDLVAGKNVDHVGPCWTIELARSIEFDTVISTEVLEHDVTWFKTVLTMARMLKPGGLMILTWAAPGRAVHNTPPGGYYWNLTLEQVELALTDFSWSHYESHTNYSHHDHYIVAIKAP